MPTDRATPRRRSWAVPSVAVALVLALALAVGFAAVLGGCGIGGDGGGSRSDRAPNIVVIQVDDASAEVMSAAVMPRSYAALRERGGTLFRNYIAVTPLCCPSRATLLTGQYAHNHGVLSNDPGYPAFRQPNNTLPVWLQSAGYTTVHLGKFLNGSAGPARSVRPSGWSEWEALLRPQDYFGYRVQLGGPRGPTRWLGRRPEDYVTTRLNRVAVEAIERLADEDQPFFLSIDHVAPHIKAGVPGDRCPDLDAAVPAPRDRDLVGSLDVELSPAARERDLSDKPSYIREQLEPPTAAELRRLERNLQCAAAALREVDRGVGEIFAAIDAAGIADETVVVLINDNGFFYGEHGLPEGKSLPYEPALRSPMLAWVPERIAGGKPPRRVEALVANLDLAPTFLELAGAAPCKPGAEGREPKCRTLDGRSLVPLLRGEAAGSFADRALLLEMTSATDRTENPGRACDWAGIRTPTETYVQYTRLPRASDWRCVKVDEREYYDLRTDPHQLENAVGDPARAERVRELHRTLERLRWCSGESCR